MYGWRGRIGLMVPTENSVMEPEFARMSPEGVSVHANRVYLKDVTPESLLAMERGVEDSARGLAGIRIGVLAFGCTSGSFVGGKGYDERLMRRMEDATGVPARVLCKLRSGPVCVAECRHPDHWLVLATRSWSVHARSQVMVDNGADRLWKRTGPGGPPGLQNRSLPASAGGLGSTPRRFRQSFVSIRTPFITSFAAI